MGGHERSDTGVRDAHSDAVDVFDCLWAYWWDWDIHCVEPLGLGMGRLLVEVRRLLVGVKKLNTTM